MAAQKKRKYLVIAPHGCGRGDWHAWKGEEVELTPSDAKPFIAMNLMVESKQSKPRKKEADNGDK